MPGDVANAGAGNGNAVLAAQLFARAPRARGLAVYDAARRLVWRSGDHEDFEVDDGVAGLPPEALSAAARPGTLALDSGRTALLVPLPGGADAPAGLVVVTYGPEDAALADADAFASECGELLALLGSHVDLERRLAEQTGRAEEMERELEFVYRIDRKMHDTSRSHSRLAELVGQSGRFLGIAYSVLLIPAKRIRISATHSSWKNVNRKAVDRYLVEKLFPRLEGQRAPVIFEMQAVPGPDDIPDQGFQALVCPLLDRLGNLQGMLAQLHRIDGTPFRRSDSRFMSHIGRKVGYVIEQSFDPMTGLMNRAGFEAQLEESLTSLESENDAHQLIYFDLDNLQLVNDTFGQEAGDEVIVRFAQIVEERLPKQAVATRLTGDDFAILLTHATVDDALQLAAEIRNGTQRLRYLEGDKSLAISVSAGVAPLVAGSEVQEALTEARIACDSAKDHGRDRAEVYDEDDQSIVRRYDDMHLVAEIQRTLDGDGFELLAQPIVPLAARPRAGTHYEILLRMRDATGNPISSKALFSAAERYQLMPQVDRWVVATVIRKLAPQAQRLSGTTFAINLSGQTLGDDGMLRFIEQELERNGLAAGILRFEVTESAAVSNRARAQALIDALRERGCRFALDDFGAGLSSFAYLKNFQVDTLKIDGSFIRDITSNRISESMVAAITQVAKVMELETVAEYVESDTTRALVAKLGVDYAQGHGVGRPVALDDVLGSLPAAVAQGAG